MNSPAESPVRTSFRTSTPRGLDSPTNLGSSDEIPRKSHAPSGAVYILLSKLLDLLASKERLEPRLYSSQAVGQSDCEVKVTIQSQAAALELLACPFKLSLSCPGEASPCTRPALWFACVFCSCWFCLIILCPRHFFAFV